MLDIEGLRVEYGAAVAVAAFDLHVADGEVVTLLGPSGCGKTSVLRAVAGLLPPAAGRIRVAGDDVTRVPAHERSVGLMFQDYALFPHRDVAGNVGFGVRMQGAPRAAVAARVGEVLALVGLRGYEHRSVASLSGGEQQRVALARALAPEPHVLMLDEPLGSLDRALRERLAVELRELFVTLGRTVVTVTHDQSEAFTLADRVVVMRGGEIVQHGAPSDVWRRPRNAFVARFLGFANVFDAVVRGGTVVTPWGPVTVERPDGPCAVVLRPDAVGFEREGAGAIRAVAGAAAFRGDHFLVAVEVGGWRVEVVDRSGAVPIPGQSVHIALDRRGLVVVDPEG